jgi:hypothetical protein
MPHLEDYSGPFDPHFSLERLSRPALARLGREIMLCSMCHDRALMPQLAKRYGLRAMTDIAIDEWMGSSPVYNRRNRELLGMGGDGVSTIFKGLQFDIGAPHQFLDFNFELVDEALGHFWLDHCGAYAHVKALARDNPGPVTQLCHDMEDPTFDATVMAVNPFARCRPVHRPPLQIGHTGPVCRWEVSIGDEHGTVEERQITRTVRRSKAASFEFRPLDGPSSEGMDDYAGAFKSDFALEDLSQPALARQCKEFALDLHLLVRASYTSIQERWGDEAMREIAREHWAGMASVYVGRIRRALGVEGNDMSAILKTLQLDPAFPGEYVAAGFELLDKRRGRFWLDDCEALRDEEPRALLTLLSDAEAPGFDAVVGMVNPRAGVRRIDPMRGAASAGAPRLAWEIEIDEGREPRPEAALAPLVRANGIESFAFRERKSHG